MLTTWDTESDRFAQGKQAPAPVCVSYHNERTPGSLELIEDSGDLLLAMMREPNAGHFIAYDHACIMAYYPDLIGPVFEAYDNDLVQDTLLNQKLIDIASGRMSAIKKFKGYDLGSVAGRYDIPIDKTDPWRLRYGELRGVPIKYWPSDASAYAIKDAIAPYDVLKGQYALDKEWTERMGSPILHQAAERARAQFALHLASCWGVRSDGFKVKQLKAATERRIMELRKELIPTGLVRPNGKKFMKAAKDRIKAAFVKRGEPVPITKTGQEKLDKGETIDRDKYTATDRDACILSGDETMVDFAELSRASSIVSRVADMELGATLPLHPRYDSLLETGRTSSSRGTSGIQIQNFPRETHYNVNAGKPDKPGMCFCGNGWDKIKNRCPRPELPGARECLMPRPGSVFVLADYSSAELHTFAQVCIDLFGHSTLAGLLNQRMDVHMWIGCHAFGKGVRYEDLPKGAKDKDPFSEWRQTAKPIVFGRLGAMGAKKIVLYARKAYQVILTAQTAQHIIDTYQGNVPEIPEYFEYIDGKLGRQDRNSKVKKRGIMRQPRSGRWRGGVTYAAMANSHFQGLAADGALAALWAVCKECYTVPSSALYGFRIIAFVHDEIVLEGPEDRAHDAAMRLQFLMEDRFNRYTPDCPTPAEPLVTRVWSKKAKAKFGADSKLIPWEPIAA